MSAFVELISKHAEVTRLPAVLIASMIDVLSGGDERHCGDDGAIGLMQIVPSTARACGVDPELLWNADLNIRLGCRILAERRNVFRKDSDDERLKLALAAYKGGLGPVINAQALAFRHGFDSAKWQNVRLMLPESWIYVDREWRKPDYRAIIHFVDSVWERYDAARKVAQER